MLEIRMEVRHVRGRGDPRMVAKMSVQEIRTEMQGGFQHTDNAVHVEGEATRDVVGVRRCSWPSMYALNRVRRKSEQKCTVDLRSWKGLR